jgi:hypothetical protein
MARPPAARIPPSRTPAHRTPAGLANWMEEAMVRGGRRGWRLGGVLTRPARAPLAGGGGAWAGADPREGARLSHGPH